MNDIKSKNIRLRASLSILRNLKSRLCRNVMSSTGSRPGTVVGQMQRQKKNPKASTYDRKISLYDGHLHIRFSDMFRFMYS